MPYWRLSGFYFFYFASLGALLPYWGLYLRTLGFNASDIGVFMAVIMATKVISPNIWGYVADRTGKRMAIIRIGSFFAAICFAGVLLVQDYWWMLAIMVAFSFFWNASLPQFEATTFNHLGRDSHNYSSIRMWGSIGFIVTVVSLGPLLDRQGAHVLPYVMLMLFAAIWGMSLLAPEHQSPQHVSEDVHLLDLLRKPAIIALLIACLFMQMSHGPYYTFYSIYLADIGYSGSIIGQLWAVGVLAEVAIFLLMHKLAPRYGLYFLLQASVLLAAVRWLIIAYFAQNLIMLVLAQLLHAASFGVYHATAIQLIHRFFTGRNQGIGQALYSSVSFGIGGALGSLFSGLSWDSIGPTMTFVVATVVACLAYISAWLGLRHPLTNGESRN